MSKLKRGYPPMLLKYKKRLKANRRLTAMPGRESHTSAGVSIRRMRSYYDGEEGGHR